MSWVLALSLPGGYNYVGAGRGSSSCLTCLLVSHLKNEAIHKFYAWGHTSEGM